MPWEIPKKISFLAVAILFLFTFFTLILDAPRTSVRRCCPKTCIYSSLCCSSRCLFRASCSAPVHVCLALVQNGGSYKACTLKRCIIFQLFGTDPDRNRVTRETPSSEAIPHRRKPLGVCASYVTQRKRRYANKCGWTQLLFCRAWDCGLN